MSRVHSAGDILFMISNYGVFGGQGTLDNIELLYYGYEPQFEFPKGSRREHSFNSGLWLSGIVGDDTVSTIAVNSLSAELPAFTPTTAFEYSTDSARGRETFLCSYAKTDTSGPTVLRVEDLLSMSVRQTSYAFMSRPYDRFVIVEFVLRNISKDDIKRPYVGLYADFDVAPWNWQPWPGYEDDLSGFLPSRCLAYTIDNDGDPVPSESHNQFASISAAGIAPIHMDPPALDTSFHWWATGGTQTWGPHFARDEYSFGSGTESHGEIYAQMANGEADYDQLWAAIDKREEGWSRPPSAPNAENIANGLDTRFLLSFGFRDLAPNDSIRLVVAYVAGDSVHVNPDDYGVHFDPDNPSVYYDHLNFADLLNNVEKARYAWFNRFELYGAAPAKVEVQALGDDAVQCDWPKAPFVHVTGYRVHRRIEGSASWEMIGQTNHEVRTWVDTGLSESGVYEYSVSSLDWSHVESPRCRPTTITLGIPPFAPVLRGKTTPQSVGLNWELDSLEDSFSEYRFLSIYRRSSLPTSPELIARVPIRPDGQGGPLLGRGRQRVTMSDYEFVDDDVSPGTTYYYSASAVNVRGGEGPRSPEIAMTPMGLERRGAVVFHTRYGSDFFVNRDSLVSFYTTWARQYGFDTMSLGFVQPIVFDSQALAHYTCLVLVVEDQRGSLTYSNFTRWLLTATNAGLKLVIILRNYGEGDLGIPSWDRPRAAVDPLFTELLGVRSIITEGFYYYRVDSAAIISRFIGANPRAEGYPAIDADSLTGMTHGLIETYIRLIKTEFLAGYAPAIGAFYDLDPSAEVLYTYNSAYDTSIYEGKPVAIRRITDSTAAIYFGFPLSQMKREQAWQALTRAVADLGIDTVNYWLPQTTTSRSMIEWLYGKSASAPDPAWDINLDGVIDIRDVVEELDR